MMLQQDFFFNGRGAEGYNYIENNSGPGQPFEAYLPKTADFYDKLVESVIIRPTPQTETAVAATGGKKPSRRETLNFQERRLDLDAWLVDGVNYKGSHFPIACFVKSQTRRSPEKHQYRWERDKAWKGRGKGVKGTKPQLRGKIRKTSSGDHHLQRNNGMTHGGIIGLGSSN